MQLNPKAFALACGILWGAGLFLATLWLMIIGSQGNTIILLGKFYWGYSLSFVGAIMGLIWGFVDGIIGGFLLAWLYNKFSPKQA